MNAALYYRRPELEEWLLVSGVVKKYIFSLLLSHCLDTITYLFRLCRSSSAFLLKNLKEFEDYSAKVRGVDVRIRFLFFGVCC